MMVHGSRVSVLVFLLAVSIPLCVHGRIHDLDVGMDTRRVFGIEPFGFLVGGKIELDVSGFQMNTASGLPPPYQMGFYMEEVSSESESIEYIERTEAEIASVCPLNDKNLLLDMARPSAWKESKTVKTVSEEGMYLIAFARCVPADAKVSFDLKLKLYNPGPNYLSAGNAPLPPLFMVLSAIYAGMLITWIVYIRKHANKTHNVHHMMTVLVVFKMLSLFFEGVTWFNVKSHGAPIGWNVLYYIFAFLKGIFLFVVVLLVGTGWSLLKPFLNDREKKVLVVVLSLQVIDNIAIIVVAEMAPGSVAFARWGDLLHLVDIICCCAVLFPIVWSIRHLRQAAAADGKARNTLARLTQFRQFYVIVVGYIYFTRIIVYLLAITLTFKLTWLGPFFAEAATLAFFTVVGYKFRPTADNPYLRVRNEDDDDDVDEEAGEFGLDGNGNSDSEGGVEMTAKRSAPPSSPKP